jgi:hypothetical protein
MKKYLGSKFMAVLVILALLLTVTMDASAYTVKQALMRFSAVAAETLVTGNVVMLKTDGLAYKADANDAALRPAIGIVGKGGAAAATVEIIVIGRLSGWSTLTEGAPGYLSETAAAVTQSSPAYSQQVGQAVTATDYIVNFQNYFDSSSLTVLGTLSGATPLVFDGATPGGFATTVAITDPTANRTVTIPNKTGQVQLASAASTLTPGVAVTLTVGLSNVYTDTVADNEDQTITFSGAGTAGDEITIVFTTVGAADEVITFHATLVSSAGTLTLGTDAGKYYVVRFISNGTHWFEVSRTAVQT